MARCASWAPKEANDRLSRLLGLVSGKTRSFSCATCRVAGHDGRRPSGARRSPSRRTARSLSPITSCRGSARLICGHVHHPTPNAGRSRERAPDHASGAQRVRPLSGLTRIPANRESRSTDLYGRSDFLVGRPTPRGRSAARRDRAAVAPTPADGAHPSRGRGGAPRGPAPLARSQLRAQTPSPSSAGRQAGRRRAPRRPPSRDRAVLHRLH